MQVAEQGVIDGRRCATHQALGSLGLREGHDLADVRLARQQHDDSVESRRDAAVGRGAVLEGLQQESEALLGLLVRDAKDFEYLALHLAAMDPDAPRTELVPVHHHVVGLRADLARVGLEQLDVIVMGHAERVVLGLPAALFLVPVEHREVEHPQRREDTGRDQVQLDGEVPPQSVQRLGDHFGLVGDHENHVAALGASALDEGCELLLREELHYGRLRALVGHGNPRQPLGPRLALELLGLPVHLHPAPLRPAGGHDSLHLTTRLDGA